MFWATGWDYRAKWTAFSALLLECIYSERLPGEPTILIRFSDLATTAPLCWLIQTDITSSTVMPWNLPIIHIISETGSVNLIQLISLKILIFLLIFNMWPLFSSVNILVITRLIIALIHMSWKILRTPVVISDMKAIHTSGALTDVLISKTTGLRPYRPTSLQKLIQYCVLVCQCTGLGHLEASWCGLLELFRRWWHEGMLVQMRRESIIIMCTWPTTIHLVNCIRDIVSQIKWIHWHIRSALHPVPRPPMVTPHLLQAPPLQTTLTSF